MRLKSADEVDACFERSALAERYADVFEHLARSRAVLRGHFALQSGLHADYFLKFRDYGSYPQFIDEAARYLVEDPTYPGVPLEAPNVVCPESAGYLLGSAVHRAVGGEEAGARLVVARLNLERRPLPVPRRGEIRADRPTIIVNDLATTGESLGPLFDLARAGGSNVFRVIHFAAVDPSRLRQAWPVGALASWLLVPRWRPVEGGVATCHGCCDGRELIPAFELN
jgi:orotate phosphoribosyltransferase